MGDDIKADLNQSFRQQQTMAWISADSVQY